MASIDKRVLEILAKYGSDLSQPHAIDFFFYFPTEEKARMAALVLKREGFEVDVDTSADGDKWLCLAMKTMLPEEAELSELRLWFESIAADLEGEYDGWGAPMTE